MSRPAKLAKPRPMKIRSGDRVHVIAGKDRGKNGKVLRVEPAKERVFVEGLNMIKRAVRPNALKRANELPGANPENQLGGVIEREGPIHVSNVMLLDPKDEKPTRIGIERADGKRYRVAKKTGRRLD
jgi:large subunit ribosomal protein L24